MEIEHEKPVLRTGLKPIQEEAAAHPKMLDISTPAKWQMALRVYLEGLSALDAEHWLDEFRIIYAVAGRVVRDRVNRGVTQYCYVCNKPFPKGIPGCEAGYFDSDRTYVHVWCCNQNEYPQLLQKVNDKVNAIQLAEEAMEKAARKAMTDVRRAQQ
jgi:hypothetical protein